MGPSTPPTRTASGRPSSSSSSSRPSRESTTFKRPSNDNCVFWMGQLSGTRDWLASAMCPDWLDLALGADWPTQVREKRSESDVAVIEDNGTQKIKINCLKPIMPYKKMSRIHH